MELLARGRTAEVYEWENGRVLKLFNRGTSSSSIDFELKVSEIASKLGGPEVFGSEIYNERRGIIFEKIAGISMLDILQKNPLKIRKMANIMATTHVNLHKQHLVDEGIPLQKKRILRAVEILTASSDAKDEIQSIVDRLNFDQKACHGDFHPDNLIVDKMDQITIIDWPTLCRGHPLGDVARTYLILTMGDIPKHVPYFRRVLINWFRKIFSNTYLNEYFKRSPFDRKDLEKWMVPMIVERLADGIEEERQPLLKLLQSQLNSDLFN